MTTKEKQHRIPRYFFIDAENIEFLQKYSDRKVPGRTMQDMVNEGIKMLRKSKNWNKVLEAGKN